MTVSIKEHNFSLKNAFLFKLNNTIFSLIFIRDTDCESPAFAERDNFVSQCTRLFVGREYCIPIV